MSGDAVSGDGMRVTAPLAAWSVRAVNLPEHADNPVHTEVGGRAAGYGGPVVAGTTVYAYLTHPVVEARGLDWVRVGGGEVRFLAAVIAHERVTVEAGGPSLVRARVDERVCATLALDAQPAEPGPPAGDRLEPVVELLDDRWASYGARVGDDLALYDREGVVHPAVWPSLANRIFSTQLVDGPWVHTRSRIVHLGVARPGETAVVEGFVVDRFTSRAGERAVVDVRVTADGRPVAAIEHEAIVRLA